MSVVQVADYLYAEIPTISKHFETFPQYQFRVGPLEWNTFDIVEAKLIQYPSEHATLSAKEKLDSIEPLDCERMQRAHTDDDAVPSEITAYRSVIEKLPYIGPLESPVIAYHASNAATKCAKRQLHNLKALNTKLKKAKKHSASITFQPAQSSKFRLETMSDAFTRSSEPQASGREGFINFRRSGDASYEIS